MSNPNPDDGMCECGCVPCVCLFGDDDEQCTNCEEWFPPDELEMCDGKEGKYCEDCREDLGLRMDDPGDGQIDERLGND